MSQQKLDEIVSMVNQGISEASQLIHENKVPEFTILDQKITEFAELLNELPPEKQKEYAPLLKAWSDEVRNISQTLGIIKDQVAGQLSGVNSGAKAIGAYGATSNLIKPK